MTTLISWHSSDGCEGRCDAKCYDAEGPDCDCICSGCNHGQGLDKALAVTRQMAEEMIQTYTGTHNLPGFAAEVNVAVYQLPLFG